MDLLTPLAHSPGLTSLSWAILKWRRSVCVLLVGQNPRAGAQVSVFPCACREGRSLKLRGGAAAHRHVWLPGHLWGESLGQGISLLCFPVPAGEGRSPKLEAGLRRIGVEKLSREDLEAMEWKELEKRIEGWRKQVKLAVSQTSSAPVRCPLGTRGCCSPSVPVLRPPLSCGSSQNRCWPALVLCFMADPRGADDGSARGASCPWKTWNPTQGRVSERS